VKREDLLVAGVPRHLGPKGLAATIRAGRRPCIGQRVDGPPTQCDRPVQMSPEILTVRTRRWSTAIARQRTLTAVVLPAHAVLLATAAVLADRTVGAVRAALPAFAALAATDARGRAFPAALVVAADAFADSR
jgi:hypothetical protein